MTAASSPEDSGTQCPCGREVLRAGKPFSDTEGVVEQYMTHYQRSCHVANGVAIEQMAQMPNGNWTFVSDPA